MLAILALGVHLLVHLCVPAGTPVCACWYTCVYLDTPVKLSSSIICVYLCISCVFVL